MINQITIKYNVQDVFYDGFIVFKARLVEALRYKPEGRGFDSRWCH
jgi:hypothetical protein